MNPESATDSSPDESTLRSLCANLEALNDTLDEPDAWPDEQLKLMADAGVLGWLIPPEYGGSDIDQQSLVEGYLALSEACLTSTFALTQRNAAIQRIVRSPNAEAKVELLPQLVTDDLFATVGISHLTTSRQHWKQPTVQIEAVDAGFIMNGDIPWVTGADRAEIVVSGGTIADGRQVLLALNMKSSGIDVKKPAQMLALNASRTASIELTQVFVPADDLLHGPIEKVMQQGGGGTGSYTTSALAIGHAARAIRILSEEADRRPDLKPIHGSFQSEHLMVVRDLREAAALSESAVSESPAESPHLTVESMRQRSNSLALRASQACLAASKGAGFIQGHPAARLVTEAMFFLVWSCPQPVVLANLHELAGSSREGV